MPPLISVITPSYNQGQYLERTIQSVIAQDIDGLEYWIIDGGSTDASLPILQRYHEKYPQMISFVSEKDRGAADAVNKGIGLSTGKYIGWLNSDDIYYPAAVQQAISFLDAYPEVDVVYGDANHIDADDRFIEAYPTQPWDWNNLLNTCYISQPAAFFRRQVFERYGLLDLRYRSMDYEYWLRIGKQGARFAYLPELLAATRLHSAAFTVAQSVRLHHEILEYMTALVGSVPDAWIYNYAHVWVRSKGLRDQAVTRFTLAVSLASLYTALRWNGKISPAMWSTVKQWIGHGMSQLFRQMQQTDRP